MTAAAIILALLLVASLVRNRQLRRRIATLQEESARALEDDGLLSQLETAEAIGSEFAKRLLAAGRSAQLSLPPAKACRFPLLDGETRELWRAEFNASPTKEERRMVNRRWHEKGYQFPNDLRIWFFEKCDDEKGRNFYRKMFDEQDRRADRRVQR